MIRECTDDDISAVASIINEAAQAYRGVIPSDCWHEPYMTRSELEAEINAGAKFWGFSESGQLAGVMALQKVKDVTLIRHAYVLPAYQARGIGGRLLNELADISARPLLVGTWAAATWAVRFYERHSFCLVSGEEKERLLTTYWRIPPRQQQESVVLVRTDV